MDNNFSADYSVYYLHFLSTYVYYTIRTPPSYKFLNCAAVRHQTFMCFRERSPLHNNTKAWSSRAPAQSYKRIRETQCVATLICWTKWSRGYLDLHTLYTGTSASKLSNTEGCRHSSKLQPSYR